MACSGLKHKRGAGAERKTLTVKTLTLKLKALPTLDELIDEGPAEVLPQRMVLDKTITLDVKGSNNISFNPPTGYDGLTSHAILRGEFPRKLLNVEASEKIVMKTCAGDITVSVKDSTVTIDVKNGNCIHMEIA